MVLVAAMARAMASASFPATGPGVFRSPLAAFLARHHFFARFYFAGVAPLAGLVRHRLALSDAPLARAVRILASSEAHRNQIRYMVVRRSSKSGGSPLSSGDSGESDSGESDYSDSDSGDSGSLAPMFPGLDFEHWLIVMDKAGGEGATKEQMIAFYIKTLAIFVGSEEEAKNKIYSVCFDRYFGFGCKIDEETSKKLEGHPGVISVIPDSYVDFEFKDYGAELFVNGVIVQRSPERQLRVEPVRRWRRGNQ